MVYYFRSITCEEEPEGYLLYMGKDKYENDDLIKHAWPEDVCPTPHLVAGGHQPAWRNPRLPSPHNWMRLFARYSANTTMGFWLPCSRY